MIGKKCQASYQAISHVTILMIHLDGTRCFHHAKASETVLPLHSSTSIPSKDLLKDQYLPPCFVRKVRESIGQQTLLEDSTGRQWPVTMSLIDGSWAFQKGWQEFALCHGLEVGHLLVFSYIKGRYFDVQIYGTSGCERMNFNSRTGQAQEKVVQNDPIQKVDTNATAENPSSSTSIASGSKFQHGRSHPMVTRASRAGSDFERQQFIPTPLSVDDPALNRGRGKAKKRSRQGQEKIVQNEPIQTVDTNATGIPSLSTAVASGSKFQQGQSHPTATIASDSGRDFGRQQFITTPLSIDDPNHILKRNDGCNQEDARTYLYDLSIFDMGKNESDTHKIEKSLGGEIVPDHSQISKQAELTANDMLKETSNLFSNFQNDEENNAVRGSDGLFSSGNEAPSVGNSKIAGRECAMIPKNRDCSVAIPLLKDPSGKEPNMAMKSAQVPLRAVKYMSSVVVPDVAAALLSVEVKCLSFLEKPVLLPPIKGVNEGGQRQIVYLRDSAGRLWPVLQTATFGVTSFSDGWKTICEENNIEPGDFIKLKPENSIWCSYRVSVINKPVV
ncbi:B3 domain-containing protein-like [Forsythia ovata]|uniref:B3 domain-containing protein-like n=1 Tax=Forsythia ovata TaxID=205694 RepID=A0ABD1PM05_9LAMI